MDSGAMEELLNKPYWIIDILPSRVPGDSPGQYFAVEAFLRKEQMAAIKQKHISLILKLNCYRAVTLEEETNPPPAHIAGIMHRQTAQFMLGDALLLSEPDDTYLTLFNPDESLLALVRSIAAGEGLYVWKGE